MIRALAVAIALLTWSGAANATQATLVTPSSPLPMTSLATFLNNAFLSIGSCNSGTAAPTNGPSSAAFAGECWANTTSATWKFQLSDDGTHWTPFGYLNTNTHIFVPTPNPAWSHANAGGL